MMRYREDEADNKLDKILRKAIAIVVIMAFMIPFITPDVFAASSVIISTKDEIKGGDTFTVTVTFDGGNIGRVDAQLLYDTSMLTYVSGGSSSGNTGYIQLKKAGTEGSITFNLEFQAVSEGTAALEVTTREMYDLDEMLLDSPSASKSIVIKGDADEGALITETASPDEPVEATELKGVDEKPDEEEMAGINMYVIFAIAAAVLVILIVIISILLAKKKKSVAAQAAQSSEDMLYSENMNRGRQQYDEQRYNHQDHNQTPRIGRSGRPLDPEPAAERSAYDHEDFGFERYDREEYDRVEKEVIRKRAKEETEVWNDWTLDDDGPDDIEKW